MNRLGQLMTWGSGLFKSGAKWALAGTALAAGTVAADKAYNMDIGGTIKRGATQVGQQGLESKELIEARGLQLDSEFKGRSGITYFASLLSSFLKLCGAKEWAEAIDNNFIKGEKQYLDGLTKELNGEESTPEQKANRAKFAADTKQAAIDLGNQAKTAAGATIDDVTNAAKNLRTDLEPTIRDAVGVYNRADASATQGLNGIASVAGKTYDSVAKTVEGIIPNALDGGNEHGAMAATAVGGILAYKTIFGGAANVLPAAAGGAAPATTSMASRFGSSILGRTMFGRAAAAGLIIAGGVAATDALSSPSSVPETQGSPFVPPRLPAASAAQPALAQPVSIMNDPKGFFNNLAAGVSSLVKTVEINGQQEYEIDWKNVASGASNNSKAAVGGALTGLSWLAGQAVDILDTVDNATGLRVIPDKDYSTVWADGAQKGYNSTLDYVGVGAPDMSGAWAQVSQVGGGVVAGGAIANSLKLGAIAGTFVRGGTTTPATAPLAAAAAGPGLRLP